MDDICVAGLYLKRREANSDLDWKHPCAQEGEIYVGIDDVDFLLCLEHYNDLTDTLEKAGLLDPGQDQ